MFEIISRVWGTIRALEMFPQLNTNTQNSENFDQKNLNFNNF